MKSIYILLFILFLKINCFSESKYITYTEEKEVANLTFKNCIPLIQYKNWMISEISNIIDNINFSIRVLIITIEQDDESLMRKINFLTNDEYNIKTKELFKKVESLSIPVITAIKGRVLGGSLELALCSDFIFCSLDSYFGLSFNNIGIGIIPRYGGIKRLTRFVGQNKAKLFLYFRYTIDPLYAHYSGLVNNIYKENELIIKVKQIAKEILENINLAVKNSKKAINEGFQVEIDKGIEIENKLYAECYDSVYPNYQMCDFLYRKKIDKERKKIEDRFKKDKEEAEKQRKEREFAKMCEYLKYYRG